LSDDDTAINILTVTKTEEESPRQPSNTSTTITSAAAVMKPTNSVSNQDFLALAIVDGNLKKVKSVVDAYTSLFGVNRGFDVVISFRYNLNSR
jgi:hypothetical protein